METSSLRFMVKRSREKKQQEETGKQQYVIVTENKLFKGDCICSFWIIPLKNLLIIHFKLVLFNFLKNFKTFLMHGIVTLKRIHCEIPNA